MSTTSFARIVRRATLTTTAVGAAAALILSGSTTAAAAAARPAVRATIGLVTSTAGHVHVAGWSFDPYRSSASNSENVIVDGLSVALPMADRSRPDVNKALRIAGRHGFDVTVTVKPGTHQVCVVSRPLPSTGGRDLIVGCRTVHVS